MIIVTGAAGFIGSNIVAGLNARGMRDILIVDDLANGHKCLNLADLDFSDYLEYDELERRMAADAMPDTVEAVFHEGACSDTTEWDGRYVMARNFTYSKTLHAWCQTHRVPFLYASSASVYGMGPEFVERRDAEKPLNMYAFSKFAFDQYVRAQADTADTADSQVAGLRYFNVYGPREGHKGRMASVARHFSNQITEDGECRLFAGSQGYGSGEQRRDFIHVNDVVAVNLWLLDNPQVSGIFNCGTGRSQTFNEVADAVIGWHGRGEKRYIEFPEALVGRYQSFTEADMAALNNAGYPYDFMPVEEGVPRYLDWLAVRG
ncbi:ADP-glyceromanno-heptose 6-epimerase [Salinisphaera sp.]|uniref:ADP-glyceromanno-heptose 6-epimerase n=1 Tax=Salinisphaera sp. TaxID=1914330 RepID=UPI002D799841|nr:ADP-glyceromanno-heptose 6-epimerase [Salinisphaera sp.]HET7313112.1 ADP-glyceromanno-heptose 6-epimerase [Salinisphaera sp.]